MIKLFVTDLDGTLLKQGKHIATEDIEAIQSLVQDGVEIAIATGRMDREIKEIYKIINQSGHRVSQNGGFVYDKEDNLVHSQTFSTELSRRLHDAIVNKTNNFFVTTANEFHVPIKTEAVKEVEEVSYFEILESPDLAEQIGQKLAPSKFSLYGETEDIERFKNELREHFDLETESYLSDPHCVDIVPKGISKADGLTRLIQTLDIKPEEIAVIGDSFNDVPMMQLTPHSYAMAIAPDDVKKHANHVVDHVYQAIEDLKARV